MKDRIMMIRKDKGLSRNEFGAKMYVSQDVINNVERGRVQPTGLLIKCICDTYGVSEDWLRNGGDDSKRYVKDLDEYKMLEAVIKENGNDPMLKSFLSNWMTLSEGNRQMLESLSAHMVKEAQNRE